MAAQAIEKVLVVDDDEVILASMRRDLTREHKRVVATTDPVHALRLAKQTRPDLAIVDLRLGSTSGIELLRELKRDRPELRAVLVSGYMSVPFAVDAVKAGADMALAKPVTARGILCRVEGRASVDLDQVTPSLERVQYEHIIRVVTDCGGNVSKAARRLGVHRQSLQRRLRSPAPRD